MAMIGNFEISRNRMHYSVVVRINLPAGGKDFRRWKGIEFRRSLVGTLTSKKCDLFFNSAFLRQSNSQHSTRV